MQGNALMLSVEGWGEVGAGWVKRVGLMIGEGSGGESKIGRVEQRRGGVGQGRRRRGRVSAGQCRAVIWHIRAW